MADDVAAEAEPTIAAAAIALTENGPTFTIPGELLARPAELRELLDRYRHGYALVHSCWCGPQGESTPDSPTARATAHQRGPGCQPTARRPRWRYSACELCESAIVRCNDGPWRHLTPRDHEARPDPADLPEIVTVVVEAPNGDRLIGTGYPRQPEYPYTDRRMCGCGAHVLRDDVASVLIEGTRHHRHAPCHVEQ